MYDICIAYLNTSQQKWFEEHVRDYRKWVNFISRRIVMQITPEVGSIVFHIYGKEEVISLYFMESRGKVWQPRSRAESQELLKFAFSPEIPELNNQGFITLKEFILSQYA